MFVNSTEPQTCTECKTHGRTVAVAESKDILV